MNYIQKVLDQLVSKGYRITKSRKAIIESIFSSSLPQSANEILLKIDKKVLDVDRATVYRTLDLLRQEGFVREIIFDSAKTLYEPNSTHHHHLLCNICGDVREIPEPMEMKQFEQRIETVTHFRISSHSLEFFGVCPKCRNLQI